MNENTTDLSAEQPAQPDATNPLEAGENLSENQIEKQAENTSIVWPEDVPVNTETKASFLTLAHTLHIPAQTAQKLVDFEANFIRAAQQEKQKEQAAWAEEVKQIFGPQWEEEVSRAVRAADAFGGPELRALLEESGLGNHPVIVRTFNQIGRRISEDNTPLGRNETTGDKTFAQAMYGTLK